MADPVSWFVIESGWKVTDASGEEIGSVDEVVGDEGNDIFNGLAIATSLLGRPRYVPAERVIEITEGVIRLDLSSDEVAGLGEFKEPPTSATIEPDRASIFTRAEAKIEAPIHSRPERVGVIRRLWFGVRRLLRR